MAAFSRIQMQRGKLVADKIDLFPFLELLYCRASSIETYLHEDLTLPKMYFRFYNEHEHLPRE